ncbi:MAG: hypothetical protein ABIN61_09185 [candidate division WOR-3 bacterium]
MFLPNINQQKIYSAFTRRVDGYNRIFWDSNRIDVPLSLEQGTEIELHVVPHKEKTEVRLWYKGEVKK